MTNQQSTTVSPAAQSLNSDNTPSVNPFAPRNTPSMGRPTTTNRVTVIERIMSRKDQPCFELFIPGQKGHAHQTVQFREIDNQRLMELFRDLPRQTKYNCELNVTWAHVKGWPVASKVEIVQKLTPQGRSTDMLIPEETKPAPVAKDFLGNALPGNPDSDDIDDIDVALGRKAETPQPAAWVLNNSARGAFMAKWGGICAHYEIAQADRETLRHEILTALTGQPSLKGWTGTDEDLLKKMEGYIKDVLKKAPTSANNAPVPPAATTDTTPTPPAAPSGLVDAGTGNDANERPATKPARALPLVDAVAAITTLAGIKVGDIPAALDAKYPQSAYKQIKLDGGRKGTDINSYAVRDRFDRVFGPHGIGWKFEAHPTMGAVRCEQLTSASGEVMNQYRATMIGHVFKYRIVLPGGAMEWAELSPMSDSGENRKEGYAFRSAFSSLLKQVLRSFGGFNHLKTA